MTWAELRAIAAGVEQTFDCEIVAFQAPDSAVAKICALDSTEWQVAVDQATQALGHLLLSGGRVLP